MSNNLITLFTDTAFMFFLSVFSVCATIIFSSWISSTTTSKLNKTILPRIENLEGDQLKAYTICVSVLNTPNIQKCIKSINSRIPLLGYQTNNTKNKDADN